MALSRLTTSDGHPLSTSDGSPIYVSTSDPGLVVRLTQLPMVAAYSYRALQPFVEESGRAWATPAPQCEE